jgi:hypothetical protein
VSKKNCRLTAKGITSKKQNFIKLLGEKKKKLSSHDATKVAHTFVS